MSKVLNPWRMKRAAIKHPRCVGCGARISPEQAFRFPVCERCQKRADAVNRQGVCNDR